MGDVAPFPHIFSKKVRLFRTWCAFSTHIFEKSAPFPHEVRLFHTYFRKMCAFSARGALFHTYFRKKCAFSARGALFPLPGVGAFWGKALPRTSRGALAFSRF